MADIIGKLDNGNQFNLTPNWVRDFEKESEMTKELVTVEGSFIELRREPSDVLDDAKKAAKALTAVIDQKPHKVMIKGKVYLEYEDWQTVAQFYGYTAKTGDAVPIEIDGVFGAKANAELIDFRTGMMAGGAEAYCMANEENWVRKPWFQLASMAQTRAGAKAIRNRMAWVVVLAGYSGTPAEEMIQEKVSDRKEREAHYCKLHQIPFFKKGKMKGYAHKIEGTDEWCNEEAVKPIEDIIGAPSDEELESSQPEYEEAIENLDLGIDKNWLDDAAKKLKWNEATLIPWLANTYGVAKDGTLHEVIGRLTAEQKAKFTNYVNRRLSELPPEKLMP